MQPGAIGVDGGATGWGPQISLDERSAPYTSVGKDPFASSFIYFLDARYSTVLTRGGRELVWGRLSGGSVSSRI